MRISARSLAMTLLAAGAASCSDSPIAGVTQGSGPGRAGFARVGFAPVFSTSAQYAAQHADQFGIEFDSVRVVIRNTPDTTTIVTDTTVFFNASSADLTLDLQIPTDVDGQRFDALMQYLSAIGQVVYSGHSIVQSYPIGGTPPAQTPITINFVGPGARAAKISVSPKAISLVDGQSLTFAVTAIDSSGSSMTAPPVAWSTSDTSLAHISSAGLLTTRGHRATVTVTATTPTGLSDKATATISLPPASIAVVSGAGQTGTVGAPLPNPVVVQVSASDGVGVPGVNVIFSAPAGGSVGLTTALTDANGRASTTLRLGTAAGLQGFAATAGTLSTTISVSAVAGSAAAIAAVAGGGQTDTVLHALRQPLIVHVSDQFNNPVAGAAVNWSRAGAGVLSASSSLTNAEGNASVSYTLGGVVGVETVSASVGGVSVPVSFTVQAVAGAPAQLVLSPAAPTTFSFVAGTTLSNAPVVKALDQANNAVAGVGVRFVVSTVGDTASVPVKDTTVVTDANGTVAMPALRLTKAGVYAVAITSSTIPKSSASLMVTVLPAQAAQIVTPNGNTVLDTVGVSPRRYPAFKVLDAYGNGVPNQRLAFSVTAPCGINSAPPASDSTGTIELTSNYLSIPTGVANPASCQLIATSQALTSKAYVIIASATTVAWTGSLSAEWMNAANWSSGAVPTSATTVYVPLYAANSPMLSADQSVGGITLADTAIVNLGGRTLTVYGTVDAGLVGVIRNGKLVVAGNGSGSSYSLRGHLPTTTCSGGSQVQLSGAVDVVGSLTLDASTLSLNGKFALVDSNFTTTGASTLSMNSPSDTLYVSGSANFAGTSNISLSDGQIVVLGNFTQTGSAASFNATSSNSVFLAGSSPVKISFDNPKNAHFSNLYVANSGSDSVHIATALFVDGTLALSAVVPLTVDSNTVTVNQLQLGRATRLVLNQRSVMSTQTCLLYSDSLNTANNASVISVGSNPAGTLRVKLQNGNAQGGCTGTTDIPAITVPGASTVTALQGALVTALRRPRSAAMLR